jgi:hypothetical protein
MELSKITYNFIYLPSLNSKLMLYLLVSHLFINNDISKGINLIKFILFIYYKVHYEVISKDNINLFFREILLNI